MPQTLDLRNIAKKTPAKAPFSSSPAPIRPTPQIHPKEPEPEIREAIPRDTQDSSSILSWTAQEKRSGTNDRKWFLVVGGLALLLAGFGIFAKSYFFTVLVAISFVVLVLYRQKEPQKIHYSIDKEGVRADKFFYSFSTLKSFWIFDRPHYKELSLETTKFLLPYLRLPLGDISGEEVKKVLRSFVEEKEHKEFLTDHLVNKLGI